MPPKYTMSDSESDAETGAPGAPSDQTLEQNLRDQVAAIFKLGNMEELTVKRVRVAVENKLDLTSGYFKSTGDWKARSGEIIREEVVSIILHCGAFSTRAGAKCGGGKGSTRQSSTRSGARSC